MHRRTLVKAAGLTLASIPFMKEGALSLFLSDPSYQLIMLTKHAGIFKEKGGTILFTLTKEGAVIVDAQFPETASHLITEIRKQSEQGFRLLINTHHHGDHSSGNLAFKGIVPHVLAHANSLLNQQSVAVKKKNEESQLYPDQTYTETWREKIGQEHVSLYYFGAGHTNGDSIIHFERDNLVHLGDLVFNRRHPFVDQSAGANIQNWMTVLDNILEKFNKKTRFICGHAGQGYDVVIKKDDIRLFREYLSNVMEYTKLQIQAGLSEAEIIKAVSIPGSPEWTGDGIDRPLKAAYAELIKSKT